MNKQELLNNPLVKEIATKFAKDSFSEKNDALNKYYDEWCKNQNKSEQNDWEITKFRSRMINTIYLYLQTNKKYKGIAEHSLEYLLKDSEFEIYSVKTPNGEFRIGDKVSWNKGINHAVIGSFVFGVSGNLCIVPTPEGGKVGVEHISHYQERKPLFTTEDGHNVFDGDDYYKIGIKDTYPSKHTADVKCNKSNALCAGYHWFKLKENAEKWFEENKPMFSKRQIQDAIRASQVGSSIWYNVDILKEQIGIK